MLFVRGVSGRDSTTCATRQASLLGTPAGTAAISVSPVALLAPGVAIIVVAERLPETGLVLAYQPKAPHPLGALPEVEVGDEQARRAAVLGGERLAIVRVGDPGFSARYVFQGEVRGVAPVAESDDVLGRALDDFEQGVH